MGSLKIQGSQYYPLQFFPDMSIVIIFHFHFISKRPESFYEMKAWYSQLYQYLYSLKFLHPSGKSPLCVLETRRKQIFWSLLWFLSETKCYVHRACRGSTRDRRSMEGMYASLGTSLVLFAHLNTSLSPSLSPTKLLGSNVFNTQLVIYRCSSFT